MEKDTDGGQPTSQELLSIKQAARRSFQGESYDKASLVGKDLRLCHFSSIGFKEAKVNDCTFNHSTFERCYFRKTDFSGVSFVGCTFRDCSFDDASFSECQLAHAEFFNCAVRYDQIEHCLPVWENTLRLLARSLRVNSQLRGDADDSRRFLLQEVRASETHFFKMAFSRNDPWYRKKYSRWEDRIRGAFGWLAFKLSGLLWGHGEQPLLVVRTGIFVILFFTVVYWAIALPVSPASGRGALTEYLLFSAATFCRAGYGAVTPPTAFARLAITAEVSIGLVLFGFLSASLYRWISKR